MPKNYGCILSGNGIIVNPSLNKRRLIDSIILIALIWELNKAYSLHIHLINKSLSSNNKGNILFKTWIAPFNFEISSNIKFNF